MQVLVLGRDLLRTGAEPLGVSSFGAMLERSRARLAQAATRAEAAPPRLWASPSRSRSPRSPVGGRSSCRDPGRRLRARFRRRTRAPGPLPEWERLVDQPADRAADVAGEPSDRAAAVRNASGIDSLARPESHQRDPARRQLVGEVDDDGAVERAVELTILDRVVPAGRRACPSSSAASRSAEVAGSNGDAEKVYVRFCRIRYGDNNFLHGAARCYPTSVIRAKRGFSVVVKPSVRTASDERKRQQ